MSEHLGNGWNGAHRALILGLRSAKDYSDELDVRIRDGETTLEGLRAARARYAQEVSELTEAIGSSDYEPPAGFDRWGEAIPIGALT